MSVLEYATQPMPEPEPSYLPRAEDAWIPESKLRDYSLDPDHEVGGHKARVFLAALGLQRRDWVFLRDQILQRVGQFPVTSTRSEPPNIVRYTVVILITGPNGQTSDVTTGWYVEGDSPPRLTSAYVSSRGSR